VHSIRFDIRAPEFGAPPADLYEAAVDAWKYLRDVHEAVMPALRDSE
jgi:hypothetical protein